MMPSQRLHPLRTAPIAILVFALALPAAALVPPAERSELVVEDPALQVSNLYRPVDRLPAALRAAVGLDVTALGAQRTRAFYDLRGGRLGTVILSTPLVPGSGVGNTLSWGALGLAPPADDAALRDAVWRALSGWLIAHRAQLGVDPAEILPRVTLHESGSVIQVHGARTVAGVPVRDSYLTAVVNHGNLVLVGTRNWGPLARSVQPAVAASAAVEAVAAHLESRARVERHRRPPELVLVPRAAGAGLGEVSIGLGYDYRLAWTVYPRLEDDAGSWEALVDAATGELLAFADRNQYFGGKMVGGVLPVSNDGQAPDGVEQPGFPLPYADAVAPFGTSTYSNANGLVAGVGGLLRTRLDGRFVRIADQCGQTDEVRSCSTLDLGTSPGTDCEVPAGSTSLGNTHSARSGFYEVNRIVESARGWLPGNSWLHDRLTANMNIPQSCNAFWNGVSINFYQSGGPCANSGEIAAVFDHEWGHGLDDNDANPTISSPGEAIADIYGILRLAEPCLGRGFIPGLSSCAGGGYGDPCLDCTGVRDLDFARHASGEPHDIDWILSDTSAPGGGCVGVSPDSPAKGPCGQETHCEGMVPAEAGWDLFARDLSATLDSNTALEVATRLFFIGGGNVGNWYQCAPGLPGNTSTAGCAADGGYLNLLAADDDNGNLGDGTPHIEAIFAAFDRHQIACVPPFGPPVTDSGCAVAPTRAPILTATAQPGGAHLSWDAVPGASRYLVFRTEGVRGCDFGKVKIGETTGTGFIDEGLLDGFEVSYSVMPISTAACMGPMSACRSVVPPPPSPEPEARLTFRELPEPLVILTGDGDRFLDNCETSRFRFEVENAGSEPLTDVRLVRVTPTSHPTTEVLTPLPLAVAPSLAGGSCGDAAAIAATGFNFVPRGVGFDEPLVFEVELAAGSPLGPVSLIGTIELRGTESDFVFFASKTFSFEEGLPPAADFQRWTVVDGSYTHASPGAAGTAFHLASSSLTPGQCDDIRSPEVKLTSTSTLSLWVQFNAEPGTPTLGFYDRANVGILDLDSGERSTVEPDGGLRPYNASGPGGVCAASAEPGWAGVEGVGFLPATWSRAALGPPSLDGKRLQLDIVYGTDPLLEGLGFQFDEVTLTDVEVQDADVSSDQCEAGNRPPTAVDDNASTAAGTPVTVDVVANDSDPDGDFLTVTAVGDPPHGTATDHGDGTVTYAPDPGFTGTDGFDYTVGDGRGGSDSATVTVTVVDEPDPNGDAGRVHGSGWLATADAGGEGKLHFSFEARPDGAGFTGKLQLHDKQAGVKIDARAIRALAAGEGCNGVPAGGGSFELAADGELNGAAASFRACGADLAQPGKDGDRVYIECTAGCAYTTAARTPDDRIDGGNVHLHGTPGRTSASASAPVSAKASPVAASAAGSPVRVVELDPLLLSAAPAGVPRVLVARVDAEDGAPAGREVSLAWTAIDGSGGSGGSAVALTDALGVAFFTVTPGLGDTGFVALSGGLESNGIELTGTATLP